MSACKDGYSSCCRRSCILHPEIYKDFLTLIAVFWDVAPCSLLDVSEERTAPIRAMDLKENVAVSFSATVPSSVKIIKLMQIL
jgi:hypothetical protein